MEYLILLNTLAIGVFTAFFTHLIKKLNTIEHELASQHHDYLVITKHNERAFERIEIEVSQLVNLLKVQESTEEVADEHEDDLVGLTEHEKEMLHRQNEFDARIARIKEEVSLRNAKTHTPAEAEELHPDVKNLPHNIIHETAYQDKEEFAE